MRGLPTGQLHIAHRAIHPSERGRGPEKATRPGAKQIDHVNRVKVGYRRKVCYRNRRPEAITAGVWIPSDGLASEIDQVCPTRAIDIKEPYTRRIEEVRAIERGAARHLHRIAEPPETEVRPVPATSRLHLHQIGQAIARHIG